MDGEKICFVIEGSIVYFFSSKLYKKVKHGELPDTFAKSCFHNYSCLMNAAFLSDTSKTYFYSAFAKKR